MTAAEARREVRANGRRARRAVESGERTVAETSLHRHLRSLHYVSTAASVGVFIAHDGEPDLMPLVDHLRANGQTVALPVLDDPAPSVPVPGTGTLGAGTGTAEMRFVGWPVGVDLTPGRFGIPVPPDGDTIVPETLLVSMVAFDRHGNRMGRGGGYFDRYLAAHGDRTNVVGVAFEAQRIDRVPTEPHDVAMPTIVTDLGVRFL